MFTWEIKNLMELRQYLITAQEYLTICKTSPQIREVKYDAFQDNFMIETDEDYKVYFKVKKEG